MLSVPRLVRLSLSIQMPPVEEAERDTVAIEGSKWRLLQPSCRHMYYPIVNAAVEIGDPGNSVRASFAVSPRDREVCDPMVPRLHGNSDVEESPLHQARPLNSHKKRFSVTKLVPDGAVPVFQGVRERLVLPVVSPGFCRMTWLCL